MNEKEYLACGNLMLDTVENGDGSFSDINLGGPAMFALAGIRLFTKNCSLVCKAGEDFIDTFAKWLNMNRVSCDSVQISSEHCNKHVIHHLKDGTYSWRSCYGAELMGYLKTTPEQIDKATNESTKGIYIAQNTDTVYWKKLTEIKDAKGFKVMWEIEPIDPDICTGPEMLKRVNTIIHGADMWSLNIHEASQLFEIPINKEEDLINEIMKMPVELTLFRAGKKGAYAVTSSNAYFFRAIDITKTVDPTGCGNCATGAAMYAHISGYSPNKVVIMANIAAGYNAAQFGPWPIITDEDMKYAQQLVDQYYQQTL